jgi:hypothetical protein
MSEKRTEWFIGTESFKRQQEPWVADVPEHVRAFLARGGQVTQVDFGVSGVKVLSVKEQQMQGRKRASLVL